MLGKNSIQNKTCLDIFSPNGQIINDFTRKKNSNNYSSIDEQKKKKKRNYSFFLVKYTRKINEQKIRSYIAQQRLIEGSKAPDRNHGRGQPEAKNGIQGL